MQQNVLVGLVLVAVLGVGVVSLLSPDIVVNVPPQEQSAPSYGALSSLELVDNPCFSIGGVEQCTISQQFIATSSTICSILNPYRATSSIMSIGVSRSASGIAGTQAFYFSTTTSTGRYGSSTPAFVDGHQEGRSNFAYHWGGGVSTSTPRAGVLETLAPDGGSRAILGPLETITVRIATSSPGTFTTYMSGKCSAVLQRL